MADKTVQEQLDELKELLVTVIANQHLATQGAAVAAPTPSPAPAVPKRVYHYDEQGLLARSEGVVNLAGNGPRVDPIVDGDCPTAVLIPATGHYVSVARPDLGEMFPGYCMRVSKQVGGDIGRIGAIIQAGDTIHIPYGGYKKDGSNWPQVADGFFNPANRQLDPQWAADDAARRARAQAQINPPVVAPAPAPGPVDVPVA